MVRYDRGLVQESRMEKMLSDHCEKGAMINEVSLRSA